MNGARAVSWAVALLSLVSVTHAQEAQPKPYHDRVSVPLNYNGPGREDPDPGDLSEVRIAYFGPGDSGHSGRDSIWEGASLAIEEANQQGGYRGLPFRLIPAWAENPWAGGAASLIRAVYVDKAWAIIGGIDGSTTHLAEQVVTKALVTLINPAATDRSIHMANVPWMFSVVPGDNLQAPLISQALKERGEPFALLSGTDHDSRAFLSELNLAFTHDRISPTLHVEFEDIHLSVGGVVDRLLKTDAKAVVVLAGTADSYVLIKAIRRAGFTGTLFAGPLLGRAIPDTPLEGVMIPVLGDIPATFRATFSARYDCPPDYAAAYGFDAATLLVEAVRNSGLNRAKIRDAVRELSPYQGITGQIQWDAVGQNQSPVTLRAVLAEHSEGPRPIGGDAR
jgi:branched-chain amino acid transport system substrate-binding protein